MNQIKNFKHHTSIHIHLPVKILGVSVTIEIQTHQKKIPNIKDGSAARYVSWIQPKPLPLQAESPLSPPDQRKSLPCGGRRSRFQE